jgi:hypothetical protein
MTKQLFDEVIGAPPPSTVDVERIITGRRRGAARRRLVAASTVAVAATVAIGMGVLPDRDAGTQASDQHRGKTPPTTAAPGPGHGKRSAASQTAAVDAALRQAAPGAEWIGGPLPGFTFEDGASTFRHGIRYQGRTGLLTVRIIFDPPATPGTVTAGTATARVPMPDGKVLSVESASQPIPGQSPLDQHQAESIARYLAADFWP